MDSIEFRQQFLAEAPALEFAKPLSLLAKPRMMGHGFGWQGNKPNQPVLIALSSGVCKTQVMVSVTAAQRGKWSIAAAEFLELAAELDVSYLAAAAKPRQFSTGSLGWHSDEHKIVRVGDDDLGVTLNFNAVLKGTKSALVDEEEANQDESATAPPPTKRPCLDGNESGQVVAEDGLACVSHNDFQAYFFPGDGSFSALVAVLLGAANTLDVAVYMLTESRLADLLLERHKTGVRVRVITDDESQHLSTSKVDKLRAAGVQVRIDRSKMIMHHKFSVVDGRVSISGSFNWTTPSAHGDNRENILICNQSNVANRFQSRFEELWTAFGPDGPGIAPLACTAPADGNCRVLFFPDNNDENLRYLVATLRSATRSIDAAVFMLTMREALCALLDAHACGVAVRIVIDDNSSHVHCGHEIGELRSAGIPVRTDRSKFQMHHKFAVLDGRTVITGSFNWTRQAEDGNEEDCVVATEHLELAAVYTHEFERLWAEFA